MSCCTSQEPDWKKEKVNEYKFDFVNVEDFVQDSVGMRLKYAFLFLLTLKSILVYMADIGAIVTLGVSGAFEQLTKNNEADAQKLCINNSFFFCSGSSFLNFLDFKARLSIIVASIVISYILLAFEWRKALKIIKSDDISFSFTNTIAYRYYIVRSFPHFCFFEEILNSRRTKDILAFYVYFSFKGTSNSYTIIQLIPQVGPVSSLLMVSVN